MGELSTFYPGWPLCITPGTRVALTFLFPLRENRGPLIVITDGPLPPGVTWLSVPDKNGGSGEMTHPAGCGGKAQFWWSANDRSRREHVTPRGCPKKNRINRIKELWGLCSAQHCVRLSFRDQQREVPQGIHDLEICSSPDMGFPNRYCLDAIIFLHKPFPPISKEWRLQRTGLVKYCSWPWQCACSLCWDPRTACPHHTSLHKTISSNIVRNRKSRNKKHETIFPLTPPLC